MPLSIENGVRARLLKKMDPVPRRKKEKITQLFLVHDRAVHQLRHLTQESKRRTDDHEYTVYIHKNAHHVPWGSSMLIDAERDVPNSQQRQKVLLRVHVQNISTVARFSQQVDDWMQVDLGTLYKRASLHTIETIVERDADGKRE